MTLAILGIVFSLVGLPMVWLALRTFRKDDAMRAWPRASGLVTGSGVNASTSKVRDKNGYYYDTTYYRPWIRYTYDVGGQTYEGTRVTRQDDANMGEKAAQKYVAPYPAETQVSVLYDRDAPATAFLEVERSGGGVFLISFGGFWMALGCLFFVLELVT